LLKIHSLNEKKLFDRWDFWALTLERTKQIKNPQEREAKLDLFIAKGKQVTKQANSFIDSLLFKLYQLNTKLNTKELKPANILVDVVNALLDYPFANEEDKLITVTKANAFDYLGDSILTTHVIYNLLKNALKIINEVGKGKITISFEQTEAANQLIFADTAKGISKEFLPHIFDAFASKDKTKKGTGLGLAFCKTVMQAYGGEIECKSQVGKYTKFILSFPKLGN
jgi:signal transduction histidine kinase